VVFGGGEGCLSPVIVTIFPPYQHPPSGVGGDGLPSEILDTPVIE